MTKKTPKKTKKRDDGFTLVEVMVVMVIIGLLTTFVVVNVLPASDKAKVVKARGDIANIESALVQYKLDMSNLPDETIGLEALKELPPGSDNAELYRTGGYISRMPNDPWNNPYVYKYPGEYGEFDIMSYGADGEPGGEGLAADIINGA